jgi:N-acetylmuramoyl-L-alanine amidase
MEEWVDYICPQIYWYIGFETANFEPILDWWIDLCKDYNVDLYVGHAAYREDLDNQPPHWRGEMIRQLEMVDTSDIVKGSVFYRFQSLKGTVGNAIRDFYTGSDGTPPRQPVMILDTLTIGIPLEDTTITATSSEARGFTIAGTSDPGKPLYMNGQEIMNRTIEGFFSVFAPLETGENAFTFSQEGQEDVTRKITRNPPRSGGGVAPSPAPVITQITTPTYATVISDAAWVFPNHSTSGGSDWMMARGQMDRVTAVSNNGYVRLSCGMWINRNFVTLQSENAFTENVFHSGEYRTGTDGGIIVWQTDVFACAYASFNGQILTLSFGMHTEAPPLTLPNDLSETIFASVNSGKHGDTPYYAFTIRDGVKLDGYYTVFEDGEFRLHLKIRKSLAESNMPLTGISIMLDPGHGGESYGAMGPLGNSLAEKHIVLINSHKLAERLTALGATVHMTRTTDVDVSVQQRVDMSLQVKPDLFLSLHINSVAETTNAANIRGFTVWHRNLNSVDISQTILDVMYYINPGTNRTRNINQANFFVCRPQWTPSVVLEASFIVNLDDFVWLIDPVMQDRMADATVEAIIEYFS